MGEALRQLDGVGVLVADGDATHRALIAEAFGRVGYVAFEAANGQETLAVATRTRPAALILDVELPDITGYEICHELRQQFGDDLVLVVVSATRVEPLDRVAAFLIGADEYLVKPFHPDELLVRVRSLLRHRGRKANGNANGNGRTPDMDVLTPREREVLVLLARGRNQSEIAEQLVVTTKTVATHIQRVLGKMGVHSRAEAVAEAYRIGLVNGDFEAHGLAEDADAGRLAPPRVVAR